MRAVWKFPLTDIAAGYVGPISAPGLDRLLTVAEQDGQTMLWAEVDTDFGEEIGVVIRVHGTGHPIGPNEVYVATVFNGPYVWHYYAELAS